MLHGRFGKMRILITGSSGFIGSNLVHFFLKYNYQIAILTRNKKSEFNKNIITLDADFTKSKSDILKFSPQYVFHLAGSSKYPSNLEEQQDLWEANLLYGSKLLHILSEIKNVTIVNFNSSLAYNDTTISPSNFYALTKVNFYNVLNFYVLNNEIKVFNLILYNVYGKGDNTKRALNYILDSVNTTTPVQMSPGEQILDFIFIEDILILCNELLSQQPVNNFEDIHVGTGEGFSLKQTALIVTEILNKKTNINFGALSYRPNEKMKNIAPIFANRFWKSTIDFKSGLHKMLEN